MFRITLTCPKPGKWRDWRYQRCLDLLWRVPSQESEELEDIKEVYNYSDVYQARKVKRLKISKGFRITLTCTKSGKWRAWRYQRCLELLWRVPSQESEELEDNKDVYYYCDVYQARKVKSLKILKRFRITLTCTKPGKWKAWRY
jgi:hypothetical protein